MFGSGARPQRVKVTTTFGEHRGALLALATGIVREHARLLETGVDQEFPAGGESRTEEQQPRRAIA